MSSSPTSPPTSTTSPTPLTAAEVDAEQLRLMAEEVILVDESDVPCGSASKHISHLNTNIRKGMLHRAFSVFLFNHKNELLLQQRAKCKITFPLRWTNTCCSHPLHGTKETEEEEAKGVKRAAIRKLNHELGITDIKESEITYLTKILYKAESDGQWGEHEVDWILFIKKDVTININENEVESTKYVTADGLRQLFKEQEQKHCSITPWFHLIAEKLLFGWWEKLDDVLRDGGIGEEQKKVVHKLKFDEQK